MAFYSRKSPRIPKYDYSSCNYYFVTICTANRRCIFGSPDQLNQFGKIVQEHILQISDHYDCVSVNKFVIMPNHIHMILVLEEENLSDLKQIIGQFKSGVSRSIGKLNPEIRLWQRSFHDHIIRNQKSYEQIWAYIEGNPMNWSKDCFFVDPCLKV